MSENNKNSGSEHQQPEDSSPRNGLGFRQMLSTILFGALGVQSNRARERDFTQGKPSHFIYFGVGFMVVFVLVIIGVVKLVLHFAGR